MNEMNNEAKGISGLASIAITFSLIFVGQLIGHNTGMWLIIFGCSVWMWVDAKKRDLTKLTGMAAIKKPFLWFICGMGLFIISFPLYLTKVFKLKKPIPKSIKVSFFATIATSLLVAFYFYGPYHTGKFSDIKLGMKMDDAANLNFCKDSGALSKCYDIGEENLRCVCDSKLLFKESVIIAVFKKEQLWSFTMTFRTDDKQIVLDKLKDEFGMPTWSDDIKTKPYVIGKLGWGKFNATLHIDDKTNINMLVIE